MMQSIQQVLLNLARRSGLFRSLRARHSHELLVLTYHSVVDVPSEPRRRFAPLYRNAVSATYFERQMRFLRRHYQVLNARELRALLAGQETFSRPVVLTFDDGLMNNFTVAAPILRRLNLPAFFFLPTAFLDASSRGELRLHWTEEITARALTDERVRTGNWHLIMEDLPIQAASVPDLIAALKRQPAVRRRHLLRQLRTRLRGEVAPTDYPADNSGHSILETMTWEQARILAEQGFEMGAHTVNHEILSRLPPSEAEREIRQSVARVEEKIERSCLFFAYPNGTSEDFNATHQHALANAGCQHAFTQMRGFNTAATPAFALRRIDVSGNHDLATFSYFASGAKLLVDRWVRRRQTF